MGCLYQIEFPNGKSYIGITMKTAAQRFKAHCDPKDNRVIGKAIRKYGQAHATLRTLVVADDWEYLCLLEQRAIQTYRAKIPHGYNMTDGGDGTLGYIPSDSARLAVSAAMKGNTHAVGNVLSAEGRISKVLKMAGNTHLLGHKHTEATKKKIGNASIGHMVTEDTRAKLSAAKLNNVNWLGRKHKAETKEKMRVASSNCSSELLKRRGIAISAAKKGVPWSESRKAAFERKRNGIA